MGNLAHFNKLPPRPRYIKLVMGVLDKQDAPLYELIAKTRLTRTQVACTLDMLVSKDIVQAYKKENKNYYRKASELST